MSTSLLTQFHALCARVLGRRLDGDVDSAIEALGYVVWLAAIGAESAIEPELATKLERLGRRTLVAIESGALGDAELDEEDRASTNATFAAIVHAALRVLRGEPRASLATARGAAALHPPEATLLRLLAGRSDGLGAGRYGLHVTSCVRCQRELTVLRSGQAELTAAEPLRLAAAKVAEVRAPSDGVSVARRTSPALEAVLFDDADARRLALYAGRNEALRVVADGVTTEETLQGYWLGKLDAKLTELDAKLHVGGKALSWRFAIAAPAKRRKPRKKPRTSRGRPAPKRKP